MAMTPDQIAVGPRPRRDRTSRSSGFRFWVLGLIVVLVGLGVYAARVRSQLVSAESRLLQETSSSGSALAVCQTSLEDRDQQIRALEDDLVSAEEAKREAQQNESACLLGRAVEATSSPSEAADSSSEAVSEE